MKRNGLMYSLAIAILVLAAAFPHIAAAQESSPPSGSPVATTGDFAGLIDIGAGRKMFLECRGSGSPTVILESGYRHSGLVWSEDLLSSTWEPADPPRTTVLPGVAAFTRVCAYDRPGTILQVGDDFEPSRSDPVPQPRDAEGMVADLHNLLAAAGIPGPYVLVGHSLGGLLVRLYASNFPDEVAGLVLVDPFTENVWARYEAALDPDDWNALNTLNRAIPVELLEIYPEAELEDFDAVIAQMRDAAARSPLQQMPLLVISHGRNLIDEIPAGVLPPDFPAELVERETVAAMSELVALVPDARRVIATESGHVIHLDQPDVVIDAIRQVVEAVRDPGTWATPVAKTIESTAV